MSFLAMLTEPGLLLTLLPMAVVLAGFITFELAMGVTIATLPRSRFQQKWSPPEKRRAVRVFLATFSVWPIGAMLILSHVYLGPPVSLVADVIAVLLFVFALRWFVRSSRERRLILDGHCVNCFYDLRANDHAANCPECGEDLDDHPVRVDQRKRAQRNAERARRARRA